MSKATEVKVELVVRDNHDLDFERDDAESAHELAARWDREMPDDAPHRVIKRTITEESIP